MLAAIVVVAAGLAAAVALTHSSGSSQRQAQSTPPAGVILTPFPGGRVILHKLAHGRGAAPATVLRTLVTRVAHHRGATVVLNPVTGAIRVTTTTR